MEQRTATHPCREELTVDAHRVLAAIHRRVKNRKNKVYTYDLEELAASLTQGRHSVTAEDVRSALIELEDLGYVERLGHGTVRIIEECCPPEVGMYEKNRPKGMSNSALKGDSYSYPESEADSSIPPLAIPTRPKGLVDGDARPGGRSSPAIASPSQARRGLRPRRGASPSGESIDAVKPASRGGSSSATSSPSSGGVVRGRRIVRKQQNRAGLAWHERPTEKWTGHNFATYWQVSREEHLRPKLRDRENVQWSPGTEVLSAMLTRLWKDENMTRPAVREMIDTFWQWVDTGQVKLTTTPWKSFLARRGDLLDAVVRSGVLEGRTSEAPDDDDDDTRAKAAEKWFGSKADAEAHEEWARKKKWF
jgi:hypothetical protein